MITKKDMVDTIALLKITYPGALKDMQEVDLQMMVEVWYQDFKNTTKEDFNKAITEIRYTEKFFPSIATIKEYLTKQKVVDFPSAEEEWEKVRNAVRRYGSYRIPEALESLNPYTRKIVQQIGFLNICQASQETQKWNRKEFIENYNSLKDKYTNELQISNKEMVLLNG